MTGVTWFKYEVLDFFSLCTIVSKMRVYDSKTLTTRLTRAEMSEFIICFFIRCTVNIFLTRKGVQDFTGTFQISMGVFWVERNYLKFLARSTGKAGQYPLLYIYIYIIFIIFFCLCVIYLIAVDSLIPWTCSNAALQKNPR